MSSIAAKQLANAHAFRECITTVNVDALADLLAPGFSYELFPATFSQAGKKSAEEFLGQVRYSTNLFEHMELLPPLDVVQGEDVVVFHMKSEGMGKSGKAFNNEYIFTFRFCGEQILSIREFVDSQYAASWFADAGKF